MKRGEIWTVSGGADFTRKPRPSVILQDNEFMATKTITLCPLTTDDADEHYVRMSVRPSGANGLIQT